MMMLSHLQGFVGAGRASASAIALAAETQGLALDFGDASLFASTGFHGSAKIKDTTTPANNYDSSPDKSLASLLTYTSPSAKLCMGPTGVYRYGPHNLYSNSASPANQSVTVLSGMAYTVGITGSVSVVASGAATGTWTAGTVNFTAATGTLTLASTSGSGTVHIRRANSDATYVKTAGSARYGLPFEWGANLATGTATQTVTVEAHSASNTRSYAVYYEGSGSVVVTGGAQAALVAGTPTHVQPTTTSLTLTVTGSVTDLSVRLLQGILIEEQRTNLQLNCTDIGTYGTNLTATLTANAALNIFGAARSTRVTFSSAPTTAGLSQNTTVVSGTTYTLSVIVRYENTRYVQLTGGSSGFGTTAFENFDLVSGVAGTAGRGAAGAAGIVSLGGGYYRLWVSAAATASAEAPIALAAVDSLAAARLSAYSGGATTVLWDHAQLEAGAFPTSPIETFGAVVTRAADTGISLNSSNFPSGATAGTLFENSELPVTDTTSPVVRLSTAGEGYVLSRSRTQIRAYLYNAGYLFANLRFDSVASRAAYSWAPGDATLYAGGACLGSVTSGTPIAASNDIRVGSDGTTCSNMILRGIRYLPRRMSNAELQTLTT